MKPAARGAIGAAGLAVTASLLIAFMGNPFSGPFGGPTQPLGGGASTEEPTFTSTQADGGAAFVAPTGSKVCLNGAPCTVYASYDGGSVGVVGAPLEAADGYASLTDDVQTAMLGEDLSVNSLVLTKNEGDADTLTLLGGRLRLTPVEVNANGWIDFDVSSGIRFGQQMNNCAGCAILTDVIYPKQTGIPVAIGDNDGVTIACQSSPGTCDTTHKGAAVCVTETASSATRICRCIRTSSTGDFRWLNTDNATRGTTTTDCPDTTP